MRTQENPRKNWDVAFKKMVAKKEDEIFISDSLLNSWDENEWEWEILSNFNLFC